MKLTLRLAVVYHREAKGKESVCTLDGLALTWLKRSFRVQLDVSCYR